MDVPSRRHSFDEPFAWWGPVWSSPNPRSIFELIADEILTVEAVAFLSILLQRRASLIVAAGPSGAGKTTLLTALLPFLPPETQRIYLRGGYEPFDFLAQTEPASTTLLVNELSPHLPIYLWGPGVQRALQAAQRGYQLIGTAHATSVDEFVYSLAGYPLRLMMAEIAATDLLILLDAWQAGNSVRRQVSAIVRLALSADGEGLTPISVARRTSRSEPLQIDKEAVRRVLAGFASAPVDLEGETGRLTDAYGRWRQERAADGETSHAV